MRNLKFDLDVKNKALVCPNPEEWYAKAYINENVANNFRSIPGTKESTKVASVVFNTILQDAGCAWNKTDSNLDAEDVEVCKLDAMVQICQYDLESSFVSLKMAQGDANWEEGEFLNHYFEALQSKVIEELQLLRWNGDTDLTAGDAPLHLCDGYIKQVTDVTANSNDVTGSLTDITKDNIVEHLTSLVTGLDEAEAGKTGDIRIYMSASNAMLYQIATLGLNTNFNYTGSLALMFAGYAISVQEGMSDDVIIAGNKDQFVYAFDGEGDAKNLKVINLSDSTAEPIIRTRVGLKAGFKVLNGAQGVTFVDVRA